MKTEVSSSPALGVLKARRLGCRVLEGSTWSARSATRTNDVDRDQRHPIVAVEKGPTRR
jgi:hypothetical protein